MVCLLSRCGLTRQHRRGDRPAGRDVQLAIAQAARNQLACSKIAQLSNRAWDPRGDLGSPYFAGNCAMRLRVSIFERTQCHSLGETIADFTRRRSVFSSGD
jgi:hypothetical protein